MIVLEDTGQGGGHQRLAETDHVADEDAAALVQMVGGDLDGLDLELEQLVAEVTRDAELRDAGASLLGQVVGHLDVDVVGRERLVRAQLSSMMRTRSSEMSRHHGSFQRSSNQWASLSQASWSRTSTFSSPWWERPDSVRLLLPTKPTAGLIVSGRKSR